MTYLPKIRLRLFLGDRLPASPISDPATYRGGQSHHDKGEAIHVHHGVLLRNPYIRMGERSKNNRDIPDLIFYTIHLYGMSNFFWKFFESDLISFKSGNMD
ncbi:MAG: hypothetical protein V4498_10365 [candidate division FCPU426 bacterium]